MTITRDLFHKQWKSMWSLSVTKHFPSSSTSFKDRGWGIPSLLPSSSPTQHLVINGGRNVIFCCHEACTCLNVLQLISDSLSWQSSELHWKLDTQPWSHGGRWRCPPKPLFSWPPLRQLGTTLVCSAFWGWWWLWQTDESKRPHLHLALAPRKQCFVIQSLQSYF